MKYTVSDGFPYYIQQAEGADYRKLFAAAETFTLLNTISEAQSAHRYAPGKWSIKQVVGHLTDHERIMVYRLLRISRRDPTPLAGYDQELLIANSRFDELPIEQLVADFKNVRTATVSFIDSLSEAQLQLKGLIWKFDMTIEAFLRSVVGHELHHMQVLKERYL